jgi:hypothetical protein
MCVKFVVTQCVINPRDRFTPDYGGVPMKRSRKAFLILVGLAALAAEKTHKKMETRRRKFRKLIGRTKETESV